MNGTFLRKYLILNIKSLWLHLLHNLYRGLVRSDGLKQGSQCLHTTTNTTKKLLLYTADWPLGAAKLHVITQLATCWSILIHEKLIARQQKSHKIEQTKRINRDKRSREKSKPWQKHTQLMGQIRHAKGTNTNNQTTRKWQQIEINAGKAKSSGRESKQKSQNKSGQSME